MRKSERESEGESWQAKQQSSGGGGDGRRAARQLLPKAEETVSVGEPSPGNL